MTKQDLMKRYRIWFSDKLYIETGLNDILELAKVLNYCKRKKKFFFLEGDCENPNLQLINPESILFVEEINKRIEVKDV